MSVCHPSVRIAFPDDVYEYINITGFSPNEAKPGMCIDIVEIWFEIANEQRQELSAGHSSVFSFQDDNICKRQQIFTSLVH